MIALSTIFYDMSDPFTFFLSLKVSKKFSEVLDIYGKLMFSMCHRLQVIVPSVILQY